MANNTFVHQNGVWRPANLLPKQSSFKSPIIHGKVGSNWRSTKKPDPNGAFQGGDLTITNGTSYSTTSKGWKFFEASAPGLALNAVGNYFFPTAGSGWQPGFSIAKIDQIKPLENFKGIFFTIHQQSEFMVGVGLHVVDNLNLISGPYPNYSEVMSVYSGNGPVTDFRLVYTASGDILSAMFFTRTNLYQFGLNLINLFREPGTSGAPLVRRCLMLGASGGGVTSTTT